MDTVISYIVGAIVMSFSLSSGVFVPALDGQTYRSSNVVHFHQKNEFRLSDYVHEAWNYYKHAHDKTYSSEAEESTRMEIFAENLLFIDRHNRKAELGLESYFLSVNEYADLTRTEFVHQMNGIRPNNGSRSGVKWSASNVTLLPAEVDWRKLGYVTPVKNQGACGSCWAFSSTGALEGQVFRKTGHLVSLSEQNLVDCSLVWGNNGCQGGLMDNSFQYIADNRGIDTELSYPYLAKDGVCHYSAKSKGGSDSGYVDLPQDSESALKEAVATIGPISVAIDASHDSFRFYKAGVYNDLLCSDQVDHGVLVVGYGTLDQHDYWLVKNSWGTSWGESGYILMSRNCGDQCGIASMASYPVV